MAEVDDQIRESFQALCDQYGGSLPPPEGLLDDARLLRRRWLAQPAVRVAGIAVAVGLVVVLVALIAAVVRGGSTSPANAPTARQLAAGHWTLIPSPPVKPCDETGSWDGRLLIVVGTTFGRNCRAHSAAYDPVANAWTKISAPPAEAGLDPVSAWDGTRLILASPDSDRIFAWTPGSDTWQTVDPLPAGQAVSSLTWSGTTMVAAGIDLRGHGVSHAGGIYRLDGSRWTALPDVPRPSKGAIGAITLGAVNNELYAVVSDSVYHSNPNNMFTTGSVRALRLSMGRWTRINPGPNLPLSQLAVSPVRKGLLVAGSSCPAGGGCTLEDGAAGLLIPNTGSVAVTSPQGMPYPQDVTAGSGTVVVTFPEDSTGSLLPGPRAGTTWLYDVVTANWMRGPTAPSLVGGDGTYWTPDGVIALGAPRHSGFGGALLVPRR